MVARSFRQDTVWLQGVEAPTAVVEKGSHAVAIKTSYHISRFGPALASRIGWDPRALPALAGDAGDGSIRASRL